MEIAMKALRTFTGTEGFIRRGEQFNVSTWERAKQLSQAGLAKAVDENQDNTEVQPETPTNEPESAENPPLADTPAPSKEETWGITATGGGWYELPDGTKVQGFDQAKERLFQFLSSEFVRPEQAKVQLVRPTSEPVIVWTDDSVPVEGDPAASEPSNTSEPTEDEQERRFEKEVKYIGGGWYLLPNGERVQGKESARDVWETLAEERE